MANVIEGRLRREGTATRQGVKAKKATRVTQWSHREDKGQKARSQSKEGEKWR